MPTVLVTGATGLIGKHLLPLLKANGFRIHLLSRKVQPHSNADAVFKWNVNEGEIDSDAFEGVTHVIHLAGAGIADERWTEARKEEILRSRVKSAALIRDTLTRRGQHIEAFISASAIGWYGSITDTHLHQEDELAAEDFLGETCRLWEQAADGFSDVAKRIVKIRTGVVLAKESGALPQMMKPFQFYVGSVLGSGKQQIQWIHIHDIARVFANACSDSSWKGAYNASATESCTNRAFSTALAHAMHRPLIPIAVPSFVLKTLLGEMSTIVLEGSRVSNQKIRATGFTFQFTQLEEALKDLI